MQIGIINFKVESKTYKFKKPLMLKGEYVDGGVCLTHNKEPYLSACDKTFTKCEKMTREQLAQIWHDHVLASNNELTPGAIILKKKLLAMVEEAK